MALRFDSTDRLSRTTNLPSETAITWCCWARRQVDTNAYGNLIELLTSGAGAGISLGLLGNGDTLATTNYIVDGGSLGTMANGAWWFAALTQNGTGAGALIGYGAIATAASLTTASQSGVSFTEATLNIGNNAAGDVFNGDMAYVKIWTAVLTQAELEAERWSAWPCRWTNLHAFYPLFTNASQTIDYSGGALTLTAAGTTTQADNPPVYWGSLPYRKGWQGNFTAAAAPPSTVRQLLMTGAGI